MSAATLSPSAYDLIVVGGGPGGYPAAATAARGGERVLLVERDLLGGTCLNRGCIPTKSFCRSAAVAMDVARASQFGIEAGAGVVPTVSMPAVVARKNAIVDELRRGVAAELSGVDVVAGEARFVSADTVAVGDTLYSAPRIIIATGSEPARLDIPGAEYALTSDEMLDLGELPGSLLIIGGGVIGMEFASIFSAFGVSVEVVEYMPEILPGFDPEIAKRLRMALRKRGISVSVSTAVKAISPEGDVTMTDRRGTTVVHRADKVLMAVGRRPVVPAGAEAVGIRVGRRGIEVSSAMMTSVPGIFAVGDVNGLSMLAHSATAQGMVALGIEQPLWPVPAAVFTDPECACVGYTAEQCREKGIEVAVGKATFRANGKAMAMGETEGLVKAVVDVARGRLAGVHICGPHAADLVQEAALAISADIPADRVAAAIHAHPTLGEALQQAVRAAL